MKKKYKFAIGDTVRTKCSYIRNNKKGFICKESIYYKYGWNFIISTAPGVVFRSENLVGSRIVLIEKTLKQ